SKGVTGFRKCRAHRVDQFRVERLSLQKRRDGHGLDKLLADMMTPRPAIGREIAHPLGKFVATRQKQPAPLHVQKIRFQFWAALRGGLACAIFRVSQAFADLLA
ncbi:MAG: hypothetical protein ACTHJS_11310, partial [Xanthobacteraceae bacterium]